MEFLLLPQSIAVVLGLFLLYRIWNLSRARTTSAVPEPPGAWPIIGHLHQLGGQNPIFRTLGAMADNHGPVFMLRLGMRRTLVVNNQEAVRDCFSANDKAFASRPSSSAGKYLGYNYAGFGFTPYGQHWRNMRKLAVAELLSARRLESLKHQRVSEVSAFIKELYSLCTDQSGKAAAEVIAISKMFDHLSINIMSKMVMGKRYFGSRDCENDEEGENFRRVIKEFMVVTGMIVLSDLIPIPFLEWLDPQGYIRLEKQIARALDPIIQGWVDDHQERRLVNGGGSVEQDFIDVILSVMEKGTIVSEYNQQTIIKATVEVLILAGSDSMSVAMTWLLSLLLNNRHAMMRAREELDNEVGTSRWVEESDLANLPYLQSVVKETLRLYPPGPMEVPREAMEDCRVCGYDVPKGTRLLVNIWKLHRDPRVWTRPNEFIPERFLTTQANVNVSGQHFEFIPFSSGRRACPGITLAMHVVPLTIARLLQGFSLGTPMDAAVDMSEGKSINLCKAFPVEVVLTPRLHPSLYQEEIRGM
ncbi:hypothetical protein Nepgr_004317 [Nepenthes gracilis]|uniref:Cytochrome P450 n=1 Tax=Nepenthes gracilis TaxID=150966 RepID=A0AAD3S176_NEPGR|nr:hypothetical protein Nepgr_004317 [Nepenthes gracilis]